MTSLYHIAKLKFIKSHTKPDNWVFRPWVSFFICIATIILDFIVMNAFFTELRSRNTLMMALGVIMAVDIIPMIVVPAYKRQLTKIDFVPKWLMFLSLAVIVAMMISMVTIKLLMMEKLNESRSVPITEVQIFLEALIPLATSTANAIVAWCTYNPLKSVIEKVMIRISECEYENIERCSRKSMYDSCSEDYRLELEIQAARKYLAICGRIDAIAADLKSYFACRLAEIIASPTQVNFLSASQEKIEIPKLKLPPGVNEADIYETPQGPNNVNEDVIYDVCVNENNKMEEKNNEKVA